MLGALGGLDVLVNNASSLGPVPLALLADTECEDLELALATNVLGPFRLTKALLGSLAASAREGRHAARGERVERRRHEPVPDWGAYGASKAALHHLSRIWDAELADEGIRVVSIDPGDMDTPLHALAVPDADRSTLKRPEAAAQRARGCDRMQPRCHDGVPPRSSRRFDDPGRRSDSAPSRCEASGRRCAMAP